jgi:hypothetical protein
MQAVQQLLGQQGNSSNSSSTGSGTGNGTGVTGGGAGIVGVATKLEQEGIRRYKDHSNYSEWEFLYEPKSAQNNGQQGNANQQGGQPAGTASTNTNSNSSFGGMSGGTPAPAGPPNN